MAKRVPMHRIGTLFAFPWKSAYRNTTSGM